MFLDAGHGGIDPGGIGETESGRRVAESEVNLPVELDTMQLLHADGFRVVVSRTKETTVARLTSADLGDGVLSLQGSHHDVVARDVCANLSEARALVGIYMDAGDSTENAGSVSIFDAARPFSESNRKLAEFLQTDVVSAMDTKGWQIPNDGIQSDASYVRR